ncbi:MAG TPA: hypothetical protein VH280_02945 [Verrucomicrobiae bacterium]|jgi:protein ImuB|nr:hypothetical protein [Verrucomicrobiae bacterium]
MLIRELLSTGASQNEIIALIDGNDSLDVTQIEGRILSRLLWIRCQILAILGRWGIHTIGQFQALGRDETLERLGAQALDLFNLLSPESVRPLKLASPPENFSEYIDFENEVETAEPLIFILRRFVEQLAERLSMIYLVVGQLELGPVNTKAVKLRQ